MCAGTQQLVQVCPWTRCSMLHKYPTHLESAPSRTRAVPQRTWLPAIPARRRPLDVPITTVQASSGSMYASYDTKS